MLATIYNIHYWEHNQFSRQILLSKGKTSQHSLPRPAGKPHFNSFPESQQSRNFRGNAVPQGESASEVAVILEDGLP